MSTIVPLDALAIGRQAVIGYLLAPYGHVLAVWPDGTWGIAPQNQTPEPKEIRIPCPGRSVISGYAAEAAEALEAMMKAGASAEQMHSQLDLTTWMDEIREKLEEAAAM